ncbi:MAG: aminoglycoside phosphotransferase family protein [Eubacterium sp.]|nr:aminoglycoside phosphotransferase family protein [Eubacterium sp.]
MAELEVKARAFNRTILNESTRTVTKTSSDSKKLIQEIEWYIKLPNEFCDLIPNIESCSADEKEPYIVMEYIKWHTLHEFLLNGDLDKKSWQRIFKCLDEVLERFSSYFSISRKGYRSMQIMYLTKTVERLEQLRENPNFSKFFDCTITVNGEMYLSLTEIEDILEKVILGGRLSKIGRFPIIHGDFCFSNILINDDFTAVKLIDPRGSFGDFDIYGDSRYDIAKLFHSVDGKYDYIINDLFSVSYESDSVAINFDIHDNGKSKDALSALKTVLKHRIGYELENIQFIEALLFFSMLPLHSDSAERQMVMLGTGIEILNRVVDITAKEE